MIFPSAFSHHPLLPYRSGGRSRRRLSNVTTLPAQSRGTKTSACSTAAILQHLHPVGSTKRETRTPHMAQPHQHPPTTARRLSIGSWGCISQLVRSFTLSSVPCILCSMLFELILLHQTPKLIFLTVNMQLPSSTQLVVIPALQFYPRYINIYHLYCVSRGDRTQSLAELQQPHFKRQNLEKG